MIKSFFRWLLVIPVLAACLLACSDTGRGNRVARQETRDGVKNGRAPRTAKSRSNVDKYLVFKSEGKTTISLYNQGGSRPLLYYSTDGATWTEWDYTRITFTSESPLYMYGDNPDGLNKSLKRFSTFMVDGDKFGVEGSIMSLIDGREEVTTIPCA